MGRRSRAEKGQLSPEKGASTRGRRQRPPQTRKLMCPTTNTLISHLCAVLGAPSPSAPTPPQLISFSHWPASPPRSLSVTASRHTGEPPTAQHPHLLLLGRVVGQHGDTNPRASAGKEGEAGGRVAPAGSSLCLRPCSVRSSAACSEDTGHEVACVRGGEVMRLELPVCQLPHITGTLEASNCWYFILFYCMRVA